MNNNTFPTLRLAVLIDGDNAQPDTISKIMTEIKKYGEPTIAYVYANWRKPTKGAWRDAIEKERLKYVEQENPKPGKNATDLALACEATEIFHTKKNVDGIVIVSSDSDFTSLVKHLLKKGMTKVFGFGKRSTPRAFVEACTQFIFVEDLLENSTQAPLAPAAVPKATRPSKKLPYSQELMEICKKAFDEVDKVEGWVTLSAFGSSLRRQKTDFNPQDYGFGAKQLLKMVKGMPQLFEIRKDGQNNSTVSIRIKPLK